MPRIRILPPAIVNRIAAGECVERPASVVKELVENALDAGATRIDVTILDGGRELIQVADDGGGMDADDLRLSVAQHATSKIEDDEDLFHIQTMGFRGEALASIGAVARLRIRSRPRGGEVAHSITVEGGEISGPTPCSGPPGSTVEVRDLFYCVPARRKFLKTNAAESGHITEQIARIALAYPGVAFTLRSQNRLVHDLPVTQSRQQRIADLFGPELADVLLPIRRESGDVQVDGLVAPPAQCRKSNKWEYLFVNGRFIRDRVISHAIKEAYRSLIQPSEFPVAFIFISTDPRTVDVNVHPTKIEVRWRDSNYVHGQVLAALREKFLMTNLDRSFRAGSPPSGGPGPLEANAYRERVRTAMVDFFMRHDGTEARRHGGEGSGGRDQGSGNRDQGPGNRGQGPPRALADRGTQEQADRVADPTRLTAPRSGAGILAGEAQESGPPRGYGGTLPDDATRAKTTSLAPAQTDEATERRSDGAETESAIGNQQVDSQSPLGHAQSAALAPAHVEASPSSLNRFAAPSLTRAMQFHNTYIVVETADGMLLIDQHALHERILYEELKRRIADRTLESQRLLLPEIVRVAPDRIEALEAHAETLASLGIDLTPAGPHTVALHAFPSLLDRMHRERFVRDLLDLLAEAAGRPARDTLLHALLDMMACKAAVKAGDPLTPEEIAALMARRELAERSSHCPHGRPTTLHLTLRDLERQFKRR